MIWPFSRPAPVDPVVTQAAFHGQIDPVISALLDAHGLTSSGSGRWLGADGPARPMFELVEWQGGSFVPRWGVALAG